MKIVADRIENGYIIAELEDGSFEKLPLSFAPDAKEGDVIHITIDHNETENVKDQLKKRLDALFDK